MSCKPYFITIEGIEGVGKSSAAQLIRSFLVSKNIPSVLTREPGGTLIAEAIRQVLLNHYPEKMQADTELLLLFAGRAQHVAQVIKPALAQGKWVICDRFTDASYAYQGGGRNIPMERIQILENFVHSDLQPDLTLLLDAPIEIALNRIQRRKKDRIEVEEFNFFRKVRQSYLDRARQFPKRYCLIDASGSLENARQQIESALMQLLELTQTKNIC